MRLGNVLVLFDAESFSSVLAYAAAESLTRHAATVVDEVPRAPMPRSVDLKTVLERVIAYYGLAPELLASRGNVHIARAV